MGQTQNRYSAPFGEKREGESHVYRHPGFVNGLNDNFRGMQTLQELLIKNADRYGKNTLLGTQVVTGQNSRHYVYKTYRECFDIARYYPLFRIGTSAKVS
jgi:long-chain acyl-CoA synthetase